MKKTFVLAIGSILVIGISGLFLLRYSQVERSVGHEAHASASEGSPKANSSAVLPTSPSLALQVHTSSAKKGPDDPLPPIGEHDLTKLIESYSPEELRMLSEVERSTKNVPPAILQDVVRMVRRKDQPKDVEVFIRDKVPGIEAKTIAYEWAMKQLLGDKYVPVRPPHQGGGNAIIEGIHGSPTTRDGQGNLINKPK